MEAEAIIQLDNLTVGYDRRPAVHHVTGSFAAAELTAVIGPNGGGKSTLLKAIAGLLNPMEGRIVTHGLTANRIAYLPQASEVDRSFPLTVMEVALLGLWPRTGWTKAISPEDQHRAEHALIDVGMGGFLHKPIAALSLGQWQRVLFARLSLQEAPIVLLDEPFAAIDSRTTHDLMHHVMEWQRAGRTVIAVMHDIPLVREHFTHALMLARECVAWGPVADVLRDEHFAQAARLAETWIDSHHTCERVA